MTQTRLPDPHPFLARIAGQLLKKADRSRGEGNVRLKLDRVAAPELHQATDGDSLKLYEMLLGELTAVGWVRLHLSKSREFQSFQDRSPVLELLDFNGLADWAGYESRHAAWDRQFLAYLRATPPGTLGPEHGAVLNYLGRSPLWALEGLEFSEGLACLRSLQALCASGESLPLREASARVFQGRSKVLDSRNELLRLLGGRADQFSEVPVQLLLAMPEEFDHVVFVENAVTFERMADLRRPTWDRALLVFAAGFRGSARRLRSPEGSRLYFRDGSSVRINLWAAAKEWLYGHKELPVYFFGDLDFSGLQILVGLREGFSNAQAWVPGYEALVALLEQGQGHAPDAAEKEGQLEPQSGGCAYGDQVLLPLLQRTGKFVDQEAWGFSQGAAGGC